VISTIWQEEKSREKIQCNSCERIFCGKKTNQEKKSSATHTKGFFVKRMRQKLPHF
jgi:hypothetical protein